MNSRPEITAALDSAHRRLVALIESLDDVRLRVPFHPGINPPVWEGGHAAFFDEVFLLRRRDGVPPFMPGMDDIWDSFVIDHEDRWTPGTVPSKAATLDYMRRIHEALLDRLAKRELVPEDLYLYKYGIFHREMHIESMIWARQTLGYPPPPFAGGSAAAAHGDASGASGDARIPAGRYRIGMPAGSPCFATTDFAFDNEKPGFEIDVPEFRVSRTLVSNREFLAFVEDGGYATEAFWSWGGRKWLHAHAAADRDVTRPPEPGKPRCPIYWRQEDGRWQERHFDRWSPLAPDHPALHVCYWEAEAYCNWAGRRLPTEFEWEIAALGRTADTMQRIFPWGDAMTGQHADMDATAFGRVPVTAFAEGDSPFGCRQMIGTAWEWTSSPFLPYDGFAVDMYPFMSTLQFGSHRTTRGGSCATSSSLIRGTYRQACLPQRRDVYVGFRTCAREN